MTTKYHFTSDWFSINIPSWNVMFAAMKGKENLKFLEVGSFQGRSAVWLLENVLTHDSSKLVCIDTWEGSREHSAELKKDLYETFLHNMQSFGNKVEARRGSSRVVLRAMEPVETFDMIYIDGDHMATSVMEDAVLAFPLLKKGGIMIFDDYRSGYFPDAKPELEHPHPAVNAFVHIWGREVKVIHSDYQVTIQKLT